MSYPLRTAPTVLAPAILLLSFLAAAGQTDFNKDRTVSRDTSSAHRRDRTRSESGRVQGNAAGKLPFEQSVIIYYKGPGKTSAASNPPVLTSRTGPVMKEGEDPKKQQTDANASLATKPAITSPVSRRANTAPDLQPVIIYNRTYRPALAVRSSERGPIDPNVKPAAAASFIRNESAANASPGTVPKLEKRSVASSGAISSGPARIANLNANLNDTLPAGPKQPISEPMVNSIPTTDSGTSPSQQGVNTPGIETANPTVEKTAERPVAPSVGAAEAPPLQRVDIPQKNVANSGPASNLAPTSQSAKMEEQAAPPPGGTSDGFETGSGPADAVRLNNSAVQLTVENRYTEAKSLLQRAIEAEPMAAKFHRNLSVLFERMRKFDEALASARTAGELAPADPSVLEQLCGLELITGNTTVAVGCYEKLRSIEQLDVVSQTYYGIALFRSGKEDESITILKQAAESTPASAQAMNALGVVYYKRKRFDDAVAAFKNGVEIGPDLFEVRFNLAVAQLALRNKAAAISQYNIIKAGDPKLADQLYRILNSDKVLFVTDLMSPRP